eukprot:31555-Pelagococcus_subviridis.AAC.12
MIVIHVIARASKSCVPTAVALDLVPRLERAQRRRPAALVQVNLKHALERLQQRALGRRHQRRVLKDFAAAVAAAAVTPLLRAHDPLPLREQLRDRTDRAIADPARHDGREVVQIRAHVERHAVVRDPPTRADADGGHLVRLLRERRRRGFLFLRAARRDVRPRAGEPLDPPGVLHAELSHRFDRDFL